MSLPIKDNLEPTFINSLINRDNYVMIGYHKFSIISGDIRANGLWTIGQDGKWYKIQMRDDKDDLNGTTSKS